MGSSWRVVSIHGSIHAHDETSYLCEIVWSVIYSLSLAESPFLLRHAFPNQVDLEHVLKLLVELIVVLDPESTRIGPVFLDFETIVAEFNHLFHVFLPCVIAHAMTEF